MAKMMLLDGFCLLCEESNVGKKIERLAKGRKTNIILCYFR